jgi:membrane protein
VHIFGNYSVTYGSLGAVIILLTWFYLSGLMLLLGAEINSEIEAAAAAKRLLAEDRPSLSAVVVSAAPAMSPSPATSDRNPDPQQNPGSGSRPAA